MTTGKMKVAWICHFSNPEIRKILPLYNKRRYGDFAPWITNLAEAFESIDDVELSIIAPHIGLKKATYTFKLRGINYYFFKPDVPLVHIGWPRFFPLDQWTNYFFNRYFVKRLLDRIKPEIVNLIGTENPYYSITTLDIKNIPVFVSAQTVYTNPDREKYSGSCDKLVWDIELKIHKKEKYFGCTGRMHRDLILNNNPNAIIFKMFFPIEKPKKVKTIPKIYDFVFFAGISSKKGIEDLIEALAIVKRKKPDVSLNIVGRCPESYMSSLLAKINELGLNQNIVFNHYFPVHSDMYQHIVQSHFAVLPVKLDIIPGSVIEAILLDLPVVTYKTTGTPYLNKDGDSVLIGNIGDIDMLAKNMLKLLNSPSLAKNLRENAKAFVEREFDNSTSAKRLVSNYKAVIEHYYNDKHIPEEQVFNINEFPLY
jgi:glycosyltransferase involved in cell wall biosynthesis